MTKPMTNVSTYVGILFVFGLLITGLVLLSTETITNTSADLDNDSIEYISQLNGIDYGAFNVTRSDLENPNLFNANGTQGNPKDEAIDFLFAKEKGSNIELVIKGIFSVPEVVLYDLLRFSANDWDWLVQLLNWVWRILILIALVYFARGVVT